MFKYVWSITFICFFAFLLLNSFVFQTNLCVLMTFCYVFPLYVHELRYSSKRCLYYGYSFEGEWSWFYFPIICPMPRSFSMCISFILTLSAFEVLRPLFLLPITDILHSADQAVYFCSCEMNMYTYTKQWDDFLNVDFRRGRLPTYCGHHIERDVITSYYWKESNGSIKNNRKTMMFVGMEIILLIADCS